MLEISLYDSEECLSSANTKCFTVGKFLPLSLDGFFKKASHVFGQQLSALFTQIGHMAGGVDSDRYSVHIQMGMGGQILCHARCGAEIVLTASKIDRSFLFLRMDNPKASAGLIWNFRFQVVLMGKERAAERRSKVMPSSCFIKAKADRKAGVY